VTTGDTRDTNATYYSFTVRDIGSFSTINRALHLAIAISGVNGSVAEGYDGTLLTSSGGRSRLPGAVALVSLSAPNVQVVGTSGLETSTMTWEVRDSLGVPVDSSYRVRFAFLSSPGGGAFISPDSGLSDAATGRINAVVHAGTVSGAIQILATVVSPSGQITSTPVRLLVNAGLPDQQHFTIYSNPINVGPGLIVANLQAAIGVIVGDKYGNPVAPNTAVYITTTIGVVTTNTGFTSDDGRASFTLFSGNPIPAGGFGYVIGRTVGLNGVTVTDSTRILFSGGPIIDSVTTSPSNIVTDTTTFILRFRVYDVNQNPMAAGTTVSVSVQGASAIASPVDPTSPLPDAQSQAYTIFTAKISKDLSVQPPILGGFTGTITVSGPNGSANRSFTGFVH